MNLKGLCAGSPEEAGGVTSLLRSWSGSSVLVLSFAPSSEAVSRLPSFTLTIVSGSNPMKEYSASLFAPIADSSRKAFSNSSWTLTKRDRGESFVSSRSAFSVSGASLCPVPKAVTHLALATLPLCSLLSTYGHFCTS